MSPTERVQIHDEPNPSMSSAAMSGNFDGPPTDIDTRPPNRTASSWEFLRAAWQVASSRTRAFAIALGVLGIGTTVGIGYALGSQSPNENQISPSISTSNTTGDPNDVGDTGDDEVKLDAGSVDIPKVAEDENEVVIIEENPSETVFLTLMEQMKFFDEEELTKLIDELDTKNIKENPQKSLEAINELIGKIQAIKVSIDSLDLNGVKIHPLSINEPVKILNESIAFLVNLERTLEKVKVKKIKDENQRNSFIEAKANLTSLKISLKDIRGLLVINLSDNELKNHSNNKDITEEMDALLGEFENVCFTSDVAGDELAIKRIQGTLVDLGFAPAGSVTGIMDDTTRTAIKRFQDSRGINVTRRLRGRWKGTTVIAAMEICG